MIRKITLFTLFLSFTAFAQVTPTLLNDLTDGNNYEGYSDMALHNNTAYISSSDAGAIFKVDLTSSAAEAQILLGDLSLPTGLAVYGNDLYFFEAADDMGTANSGILWKLDLSNPAATPVQLFAGLTLPTEIEVSGTNVYFAENFTVMSELDHGQLSMINLSGTPTKTVLYDELYSLDDLELHGTDLYLVEWKESTEQISILKLNVASGMPGTPSLYYADTQGYAPYRLEISGDSLYFNTDSSVNPSVMKLDLNAASPTAEVVVTPFIFNEQGVYVSEMIVDATNTMYAFGSNFDGTIDHYLLFSADLNLLGTDNNALPIVAAYPNPCKDVLNINGHVNPAAYVVYDAMGKKVMNGSTGVTASIDMTSMAKGLYFVQLDGMNTIKVIKE